MPVGDLHWAVLPPSDGYEQAGRRPVMVIQVDGYAGSLPTVLVVPLTSSPAALRFPGTVAVPATPTNGLPQDSIALVFQLRALDRRRLQAGIGVVDPPVVAQVYEALDRLTGHP